MRTPRDSLSPDGLTPAARAGLDDGQLIARSQSDGTLFAELYDRHAPALHRFAARRLGDDAADDVIAETFLAAFRRREHYDSRRPDARPWLYGIASRVIGRHRRAEIRRLRALARIGVDSRVDAGGSDEVDEVDDRLTASGTRPALARALAALAPEHRDVLLLVAWADLSYEEVAQALEIRVGTVRSRLNRARRRVRAELTATDPAMFEQGAPT